MAVFIRFSMAIPFVALAVALLTPAKTQGTTVSFCVGDCDANGMVTVDELIRGINIGLGNLSLSACLVFDSSGDGLVTVDEIVTAVFNGLNGCPSLPTATATATSTRTTTATPTATVAASATPTATVGTPATPTASASPGPPQASRVLVTTDAPFGNPDTIVTSLGTPIISPMGFVIVSAELTRNESETQETLLRFEESGSGSIVLAQGQQIPNSSASVGSISQPNAKATGVFVFVDAANGASLLQINDGTIIPLLGLGAPATRAGFESRMFVVPVAGGFVVADAFVPGGTRAVVAIDLNSMGAPIPIVAHDETLSYRNNDGDLVEATVTAIESVFAERGAGSAAIILDDLTEGVLSFTFNDAMLLDRNLPLVQGNQAPGLSSGTTLEGFGDGARIGGMIGNSARGFRTFLSETEFPGFSESAAYITAPDYSPLFIVQAGAPVPDVAGATIDSPRPPVMGRRGAAVGYMLIDQNERAAIGFVDYQTQTFRTLVVAGDSAPDGGVFTNLPFSFAINENDDLIFRGDFGGGQSAYYAVSTTSAGATPRRLVRTGDTVAVPQEGMKAITSLGMIAPTGGLGGEATAVGTTHFTVGASLDDSQGAILLVEVGE